MQGVAAASTSCRNEDVMRERIRPLSCYSHSQTNVSLSLSLRLRRRTNTFLFSATTHNYVLLYFPTSKLISDRSLYLGLIQRIQRIRCAWESHHGSIGLQIVGKAEPTVCRLHIQKDGEITRHFFFWVAGTELQSMVISIGNDRGCRFQLNTFLQSC